jgi:MFS family permease
VLLASQPTRRQELERQSDSRKQIKRDDEHPESQWYKAYGLAMAADWLQVSREPRAEDKSTCVVLTILPHQGPYLFSLYRDEYGLDPGLILNLYLTDFVTTAIAAYFIGTLSDKYGRKLFCMVYCLTYALSCFLTAMPITPLLYLGRILGGISTTILFIVFDAWMVTNFRDRKLAEDGCDLTRTYATSSVVNSLVAIASGLVGEILVWVTGTKKAPFIMSVVLLWLALQAIWSRWVRYCCPYLTSLLWSFNS